MTRRVGQLDFGAMDAEEIATTAISRVALKSRSILFALFLLIPAGYPSSADCLENAGKILKDLDAHYYYPQKQGLKKLSVQVQWEQLDVITDSGMYLKNPPLVFNWEKEASGSSHGVFKFADDSFEVSKERKRELLNMLENYKEVLIPKTLTEKMSGHVGKIKTARKQKRLLEFSSNNPQAPVRQYDLMVDLKQKHVRKIRIERNEAPLEVKSEVRYTEKSGKWLIAESRSRFRVGAMDYDETTEYVYRRAGKFWLVGKMTQTIKSDDRIIQSFVFRFSNYRAN